MKQIRFEIKKLHKQKSFVIVLIVAILAGIWSVQTVKTPYFFTPLREDRSPMVTLLYEDIMVPLYIEEGVLGYDETRDTILREYEALDNLYRENKDLRRSWESYDEAQSKRYLEAKAVFQQQVMDFVTKYNLEFSEEVSKEVEWDRVETSYLLDNDILYEEGDVAGTTGITASLVMRYNMEELLGIAAILILVH